VKLIQAMKKLKDLKAKAEDLRGKVGVYCAKLSIETATYPDQGQQVREWLQAHHDLVKEVLRLRLAVQRTNLDTQVTIEVDGRHVTKPLAAWIHRRRDLALLEREMWGKLGDRGLREQQVNTVPGGQPTSVTVTRYYDPVERDKKMEAYRTEPSVIDAALEVVNATTELIEEDRLLEKAA
jgi:hypothetical protein